MSTGRAKRGSRRRLPLARVAQLIAALAGGFAASAIFADSSSTVLSALVAALAVVGAFELAMALRRAISGGEAKDTLGVAALEASGDAMVVVEDGERVAEANTAYLRMSRSAPAEAPTPERFLARVPGSQGLVGEMLDAVARGVVHNRSISFATGQRGRQLEVSVHPLETPRRVLWTLRLAEEPAPPQPAPAPAPQDEAGSELVALWEHAPVGIVRLAADRALVPNASFCRMLGYALADIGPDGLDVREVVAPEDLSRLATARADRRGRGALVLTLTRKDGTALPVLMRLHLPQEGAGVQSVTAAVLPLDAVRDLLPAAEPAARIDADSDLFFQRAPLAMALMDASGRVRAANAAFTRLFGREAAGRPLSALVSESAAAEALLAGAPAAGAPAEPCDVTVAGGGHSARLYAAPLGSAPGSEIALCAIDTTEQKQLEAQFTESQKLQAVGHLAGGVAHDFNNMLTAILGYCDLLLAKHRPSDPSFPDLMQIKQNANRAAGMVGQLLAFSRRQTLRPKVIELTDVISDAAALLRRLIGERITLEVQHARELWPVKVDKNQFEQVIINLAVNARDAMPDGGVLTLRTENVPAGACAAYGQRLPAADYVLVEVSDTGTGIPPEIMDKIFEPFFSTKEVGKGTGLGLSTVYGIVQQTGGTILAESELGRGTTFRVFLPRHEGAAEEAPRSTEPETKIADLSGHGRVLLVEDEDAVRAFASRALANRGYEVLSASSGVEALEVIAKAGKVDLVVSDVVMPEMDGPTLLRELRARDPGLKVIFISGYAEEAFARNLPPTEHFSFLPKPFSLKQLVATVAETLRA